MLFGLTETRPGGDQAAGKDNVDLRVIAMRVLYATLGYWVGDGKRTRSWLTHYFGSYISF